MRHKRIGGLAVLFILGIAGSAWAKEYTFWELVAGYIDIIAEMCPVRHPFGHWGGHATWGMAAMQWSVIAAVLALGVRLARRGWSFARIGITFTLVVLLGLVFADSAWAKEDLSTFDKMMVIVMMFCPVRHPFGHWFGHETWALAAAQWSIISGLVVGAGLWRRR